MLGLGDDHVVALAAVAQGVADQREVVGLGGSGREDDLPRVGTEVRGHLGARRLKGGRGVVAHGVQGRGVAERAAEIGQHGVDHAWVDGPAGLVIGVHHAAGRG